MKFTEGGFLKHRNDCCDFIKVLKCISDTGGEAEVVSEWYTRVHKGYKKVSNENQIKISKRQYPLWRAYIPEGKLLE